MSSKFLDKTGLGTLWAKIKSTFQTIGNKVTSVRATSSASDDKYPSEKAVASALDGKAPKASPALTGTPTAPTAAAGTNTTQIATTAFVTAASTDSKLYANAKWGGAFRSNLAPDDTYFLQQRNCFFGAKPSAISVEYSTNGGTTWIDYELTEAQKYGLFSQYAGTNVYCGKNTHILPTYTGSIQGTKDLSDANVADQRLRITICCEAIANFGTAATTDKWLYATIRRIGIYMSTNSASRGPRHCVFTAMKKTDFRAGNDTWVNFGDYAIAGDSGWNSIPCSNATSEGGITFGDSYDTQYSMFRFEVWSEGVNTSPAPSQTGNMAVIKITAFSELCWVNSSSNSNLANYGLPCMVEAPTGLSNFAKGIKFTARKLKTNLARTADSTFDGSADQTNIPVTGTLPVANGGTGATTAIGAEYNILNQVADIDTTINGDRKIALCNQTKSASNGVFRWLKLSNVWVWIKGLLSSESGVNISGNAATATTAADYTSGGAIDTALQGKATPADITFAIQALDVASQGGDGKYIKAISEVDGEISATAETMDTAPTTNSTKAVTSGGVKTALDGKVDTKTGWGLSTNDYTTTEKDKLAGIASGAEVNVQSDWNQADSTADDYIKNKPDVSRYFNKYSSSNSVYGWKIGSTVTNNSNGVSSVITGVFTLALGINVENAPQESTAVKTKATMVGFFSCYTRYESGANVVKARIYTPVSSISDSNFNLKYIDEGNGKFTWVLGFGNGTTPASKNYVYCSVNVMSSVNANFDNFGDAITSSPTYGDGAYFTVFKSPVIGQNTSGVGNATKPVYVDTNGVMKACTSVDADTVDGLHLSTSSSGTATNTIYFV